MSIKKVTAIIGELMLDNVEQALMDHGVTGFTIHPVKGRGYYANLYSEDGLVSHSQIEIFTNGEYAKKIVNLIMKITNIGVDGQGLIAVTSVDELYGIGKKSLVNESQFNFFDNVSDA
ncbi:MAG: transcriptional regulator [Gammaproteobacteria bacterium]|nr:MAG: transcriptional regulator [Gammaproteobacteria bacterium]